LLIITLQEVAMSVLSEFRSFMQRGNVVDMAVGVILGGAFGKIVSSLVTDVLTPPLGYITGGVDFKNLSIKIGDSAAAPVEIKYGMFLQATFDFLIIGFCVFVLIKAINQLQRKEAATPAAPPEPSAEVQLLGEIRDLLKARA
jgi:large conductance mechanosensitive channel